MPGYEFVAMTCSVACYLDPHTLIILVQFCRDVQELSQINSCRSPPYENTRASPLMDS